MSVGGVAVPVVESGGWEGVTAVKSAWHCVEVAVLWLTQSERIFAMVLILL
jgi:hypothetical protein